MGAEAQPPGHHVSYKTELSWTMFSLEKMTDKYSRSECWIDIFAKMNGLGLSFQEKHPAMSITNGDIQTFKQKLEFWKTYLLSWKRVLGSDLWEVNRQLVNIEVRQHLGELRSWASCCLQWQLWSSRTILDLPLGAGLQIPYCSDPRNDHMIKFDVISKYNHSDMTNVAKYCSLSQVWWFTPIIPALGRWKIRSSGPVWTACSPIRKISKWKENRPSRMALWMKVLATKLDDFILVSGTPTVEGKTVLWMFSSGLRVSTTWYMPFSWQ